MQGCIIASLTGSHVIYHEDARGGRVARDADACMTLITATGASNCIASTSDWLLHTKEIGIIAGPLHTTSSWLCVCC